MELLVLLGIFLFLVMTRGSGYAVAIMIGVVAIIALGGLGLLPLFF